MLKKIKKNIWLIIKLEFILGIIISMIFLPLSKFIFNYSLKLTGLNYLTQSNILMFIKNPLIIIGGMIFLYIISFITIFEISALNIIYIKSSKDETMTIIELIKSTIVNSSYMFRSKNILLFIYIIIFLPLAGVVYKNSIIKELSIPSFILDHVFNSTKLTLILVLIYVIILSLSLLSIYIFIIMISEKKNYFTALKRSIKMFRQKKKKLLLKMLLKSIVVICLIFVVNLIQEITIEHIMCIDNSICKLLLTILNIIFNLFIGTFIAAFVKVDMLYVVNESYFTDNTMPKLKEVKKRQIRIHKSIIIIVTTLSICILSLLVCTVVFFMSPSDMIVIAHRGSSIVELENTKEAFIKAMDDKVKCIELDVVETLDKQVVVLHDLNLKRLANINQEVSTMTWDEIKDVTIYSEDKLKKGHIMLLKDLLEIINKDVVLNIELKPDGKNDEELATLVESIIENYPRHIVCSFSQESLKKIKEINIDRKTGLIMAIALGDYVKIPYIDFYSIEESFITDSIVDKIHNKGKKVFAWTVNDTDNILNFLVYNVDGIITDYPVRMENVIQEVKQNFTQYVLKSLIKNKE